MAFQIATFLFSIVALLPCFTGATLNPKVAFTVTPSTIEIGTDTLARCTISGLETANYSSFSVDFFITPSSGSFNNTEPLSFASWSTTNASAKGNYTQDSSVLQRLDLAASAGHSGVYPHYEVKIHPMNASSTGAYWCLLQVDSSPKVTSAFSSNQINTSPPVSSATLSLRTAPLTPPYYNRGSPFSVLCSVTSHDPLLFYTVSYYFSQAGKDTSKKLAFYSVSGGESNPKIVPSIDNATADLGWTLSSGSISLPGRFELRVSTSSDGLVGGWFICSVAVGKSAGDQSGREYYSEAGLVLPSKPKVPANGAPLGERGATLGTLLGALLLSLLIGTF